MQVYNPRDFLRIDFMTRLRKTMAILLNEARLVQREGAVFTPSSTLNSLFEYVDDLLVEDMSRPLLEHQREAVDFAQELACFVRDLQGMRLRIITDEQPTKDEKTEGMEEVERERMEKDKELNDRIEKKAKELREQIEKKLRDARKREERFERNEKTPELIEAQQLAKKKQKELVRQKNITLGMLKEQKAERQREERERKDREWREEMDRIARMTEFNPVRGRGLPSILKKSNGNTRESIGIRGLDPSPKAPNSLEDDLFRPYDVGTTILFSSNCGRATQNISKEADCSREESAMNTKPPCGDQRDKELNDRIEKKAKELREQLEKKLRDDNAPMPVDNGMISILRGVVKEEDPDLPTILAKKFPILYARPMSSSRKPPNAAATAVIVEQSESAMRTEPQCKGNDNAPMPVDPGTISILRGVVKEEDPDLPTTSAKKFPILYARPTSSSRKPTNAAATEVIVEQSESAMRTEAPCKSKDDSPMSVDPGTTSILRGVVKEEGPDRPTTSVKTFVGMFAHPILYEPPTGSCKPPTAAATAVIMEQEESAMRTEPPCKGNDNATMPVDPGTISILRGVVKEEYPDRPTTSANKFPIVYARATRTRGRRPRKSAAATAVIMEQQPIDLSKLTDNTDDAARRQLEQMDTTIDNVASRKNDPPLPAYCLKAAMGRGTKRPHRATSSFTFPKLVESKEPISKEPRKEPVKPVPSPSRFAVVRETARKPFRVNARVDTVQRVVVNTKPDDYMGLATLVNSYSASSFMRKNDSLQEPTKVSKATAEQEKNIRFVRGKMMTQWNNPVPALIDSTSTDVSQEMIQSDHPMADPAESIKSASTGMSEESNASVDTVQRVVVNTKPDDYKGLATLVKSYSPASFMRKNDRLQEPFIRDKRKIQWNNLIPASIDSRSIDVSQEIIQSEQLMADPAESIKSTSTDISKESEKAISTSTPAAPSMSFGVSRMIVHSGKMMMRCHYSDCDYIYERRLTSNEPIRNEHIESAHTRPHWMYWMRNDRLKLMAGTICPFCNFAVEKVALLCDHIFDCHPTHVDNTLNIYSCSTCKVYCNRIYKIYEHWQQSKCNGNLLVESSSDPSILQI